MVSKKGKGSFFRPLCFEFYEDGMTFYEEVMETQFLVGSGLMVAPIVQPDSDERAVYFPGRDTKWY